MARSKSIIDVAIIGDARKLVTAVGQADTATGGLLKSAAKVAVAGVGVRKGFDLINDSLHEADRRGDAITRLGNSIGEIDTDKLAKTASEFTEIGASGQDMLELEAIFADLATSAGVSAPAITANAEQLAAMALAAAQVHDADPTAIIDAIGKAVGGQTRGIKEYGIDLTEAAVQQRAMQDTGKDLPAQLTATELAAARTSLIMEGFAPILADVTSGTGDLELKQDELGAKFEDVGGKVGAYVEGPATAALDWIGDMVDAIPSAIDGFDMLGFAIVDFGRDVMTPLARVRDTLEGILDLLGQVGRSRVGNDPIGDFIFGGSTDRETQKAVNRERNRLGA